MWCVRFIRIYVLSILSTSSIFNVQHETDLIAKNTWEYVTQKWSLQKGYNIGLAYFRFIIPPFVCNHLWRPVQFFQLTFYCSLRLYIHINDRIDFMIVVYCDCWEFIFFLFIKFAYTLYSEKVVSNIRWIYKGN